MKFHVTNSINSGCVTSIARLFISIQLSKTKDQTYVRAQDALWTYAEVTSAILVSVFPVLPQFFRHHVASAKAKSGKDLTESRRTSFSRAPSPDSDSALMHGSKADRNIHNAGASYEPMSNSKQMREARQSLERSNGFDFAFGDLGSPLGDKASGISALA